MRTHKRSGLKRQRGQAMLEFAVVLPILLLLTLGTVLLTLSYIQKARMNGLAYMSARVAAVRRPNFDAANYTLNQYKLQSKQTWTDEVSVTQPALSPGHVGIRLQKPGERLDLLANLISGQPGQQPQDLIVEMQLPREYKESGSLRPATYSEVDYQYSGISGAFGALSGPLKKLLDVEQLADPKGSSLDERDQNLSLNPVNANLKKYYQKRDWLDAFENNDETPTGQFKGMIELHDKFKALEAPGGVLSELIGLLGPFAKLITSILGSIGAEVAGTIEVGAHGFAEVLDQNIRSSVGGGS